jgi:hypothetical protein
MTALPQGTDAPVFYRVNLEGVAETQDPAHPEEKPVNRTPFLCQLFPHEGKPFRVMSGGDDLAEIKPEAF